MIKEQLAKLAVKYNLATDYTHYLVVHVRAEGEKGASLPEIKQVKQMLAAGWGGSSSVRRQPSAVMQQPMPMQIIRVGCDDAPFNYDLSEELSDGMPSVLTSRRERALVTDQSAMDAADIPAFLRKKVVDEVTLKYKHADLLAVLKKLLVLVNDGLTHPDDFPDLVSRLDSASELNLLQDIVDAIDKQGLQPDEIWVALISWAAQQLGAECQLTRHALRSIQSLSGAIEPNRITELVGQFAEWDMERLDPFGPA